MPTVGLIVAMQQEIDPLLRRVGKSSPARMGSFRGCRFELAGRDCRLVRCNVGARNAARATEALLAEFRPDLLVSYGIAGAVESDLRIGDVVLAQSSWRLEGGVAGQRLPLADVSSGAREAAGRALAARGARLSAGTILTTSGPQLVERQPGELPRPVLEMETAGVAAVAAETGIPLLGLRGISDNPQAPIPIPIEKMYGADDRLRIGRILWEMLRRPALVAQFARLAHNSSLAEENVAEALAAILSQPADERSGGSSG